MNGNILYATAREPNSSEIDSAGPVFAAFDSVAVVLVTDADATFALFSGETRTFLTGARGASVVVALILEDPPETVYRGPRSDPIPPDAERVIRYLLSQERIDDLGLVFQPDPPS